MGNKIKIFGKHVHLWLLATLAITSSHACPSVASGAVPVGEDRHVQPLPLRVFIFKTRVGDRSHRHVNT